MICCVALLAAFGTSVASGIIKVAAMAPGSPCVGSESNETRSSSYDTALVYYYSTWVSSLKSSYGATTSTIKYFDIYNKSTASCKGVGAGYSNTDTCVIKKSFSPATSTDSCAGSYCYLKEYYVTWQNLNNPIGSAFYKCPLGCSNGACTKPATTTPSCIDEGKSIPVIANPPLCCSGLTKIKPKTPNIIGSDGICTAKCGNGVCDTLTESNYNCSKDCLAAYFKFTDNFATFIFQLTDPLKIQKARDILNGRETKATHVMGTVVALPGNYNPSWSFILNPSMVIFFQNAAELCDSSIEGVEKNLKNWSDKTWCPWASKLVGEFYY
jgi:hypothetical protein